MEKQKYVYFKHRSSIYEKFKIKTHFFKKYTCNFKFLNKDYTQFDHVFSAFLPKNAVGEVRSCGSSLYAYDAETRSYTTLLDGEEWCWLEVETPLFEEDFEESSGWVKAKDLTDLRTLSTEELAKI